MHLFHGLGNGALGPKTTFETGPANGEWPSMRTINGAIEILAGERSGHLGLLHFANGSLSVSRVVAGPQFDLSSTFGDVNDDGVADIIDTDLDDSGVNEPICVTLANADGTFRERRRSHARERPQSPLRSA